MNHDPIPRRLLLKRVGALVLLTAMERLVPSYVWASSAKGAVDTSPLSGTVIDLIIAETPDRKSVV
jgi:hypothetical protein